MVIGYFVYYRLYAGNFYYYFSGAWTHEENQLSTLFKPGFYLFNRAINIPKIIAVPLTLAVTIALSYLILSKIEKRLRIHLKKRNPYINSEKVLHKMLTISTFLAFNCFFIYGGRPEILRLPIPVQMLFDTTVVIVSTIWLVKTWRRSFEEYERDSLAHVFRRQLSNSAIDISQLLIGLSLDELSSNELFILASALPQYQQLDRLKIYKSIFQEGLTLSNFSPSDSFEVLKEIRHKLALIEKDHYDILSEISSEQPSLVYPNYTSNNRNTPTNKVADYFYEIEETQRRQ